MTMLRPVAKLHKANRAAAGGYTHSSDERLRAVINDLSATSRKAHIPTSKTAGVK